MLNDLRYRLRALFRRDRADDDLNDELQFHLEQQTAKHIGAGLDPQSAARQARLDLGGLTQVAQTTREAWGVRLIESTLQDFAYACRLVVKRPGFTAAIALSLGLGIGANTAIFTLMDVALWRGLPVSDPEHLLVAARQEDDETWNGYTYSEFRGLRTDSTLVDVAGYSTRPLNVAIDGPPEPSVTGQLVSGNYFTVLGATAPIGRTLGPDDDRVPNGHPVAMLSDGYWTRRFARDTSIVGRTIRVSDAPFTIVGIAPPGFFGAEVGVSVDLFLPIMMQPTVMPAFENLLDRPGVSRTWIRTIARTAPGVTPQRAGAALTTALFTPTAMASGKAGQKLTSTPARIVLMPATSLSSLRTQFATPLFVLLCMVGVVLLIACANTANLLLARAASRRAEFGLRLALGAGRLRLIRQLLVESVSLAALGSIVGVALAGWGTPLLVRFLSVGRTPLSLDLVPNARILLFTTAIAAATGVLFGLAPAWRATRLDLTTAFSAGRRSVTRGLRPGRVLSIVQLALTLLLLAAAGLFVRNLHQLNGDDRDGLRDSVMTLRVEPRGSDQRGIRGTSERLDRIYRDLIARVRALPGVALASMANTTPTEPESSMGNTAKTLSGEEVDVAQLSIYPNYFATVGTAMMRGRDFTSGDLPRQSAPVCIVNEAFVRRIYPDADPIGRPCMSDLLPRGLTDDARGPYPFVIVGVVADSRFSNPSGRVPPLIFTTFAQTNTGRGQMVLHVRVQGHPSDLLARIRQEVASVDPSVPMFDVHTLGEEMSAALVQQRLVALLSSVFGALALTLACVGLYGLLAFGVVQRQAELAVRLALGARRGQVLRLVLREAAALVGVGIAVGTLATWFAVRAASSRLAGLTASLSATDPIAIASAIGILLLVAAVAAYLPARRASRVDPMVALKAE